MKRSTTLKLVGAFVAVAAIAGGGAAIAATKVFSPQEENQAVINDAAKQLGVEPSKLDAALRKALANQIDDAVAAGRLTKEQGAELKKRLESGDVPLLFPGFGLRHGDFGLGFPAPFAKLDAAAKYLDLSEAELRSRLNDGKTLAQIAKDQGKTVDGLVNALVKDARDRIDAAVASGKLTKSQADDLEAGLKERMTDLVEGKLRFAHHFDFHAPGPAFRGFSRPDFMPDFRFRGFDRAPRRGQSA